jgi:hypothetical protein
MYPLIPNEPLFPFYQVELKSPEKSDLYSAELPETAPADVS